MSQGNSNQLLRTRIRRLEGAVSTAYTALQAAAPVTNALMEYFRANEACQPDPGTSDSRETANAAADRFLKARAVMLEMLASVNMR